MTWVVTGAGGQLGLALSKQLILEGVDFIPLLSSQLDITKPPSIRSELLKKQKETMAKGIILGIIVLTIVSLFL